MDEDCEGCTVYTVVLYMLETGITFKGSSVGGDKAPEASSGQGMKAGSVVLEHRKRKHRWWGLCSITLRKVVGPSGRVVPLAVLSRVGARV